MEQNLLSDEFGEFCPDFALLLFFVITVLLPSDRFLHNGDQLDHSDNSNSSAC
jgi:hypothetical protein